MSYQNRGPGAPVHAQSAPQQRQFQEAKGKRAIGLGAVWLLAGIVITAVTYSNAVGGGVYIVAWGPMLYGVIRIVGGANLLRKARR